MSERCGASPAQRESSRIVRLGRVAEAQGGPFDVSQLREVGFTSSSIGRWVTAGRFVRLYPEVYALAPAVMRIEGQLKAALLYVGPGAALSHVTAAWWWEIWGSEPRWIHVSTPRARRSHRRVRVHGRRAVEVVVHRGLEVTTVPQTLLDLAVTVRFDDLRQAVANAEFCDRLDLADLETVLGQGRPGSAALRRALKRHLPELARTRSELERLFVFLCETYRIPMPEVNAKVEGLIVDALWREQRVIVELDGGPAHASAARMRNDRRRELKLRGAGYTVLRYSWDQVAGEHALVAEDVLAALAAAEAGGASAA